MAAASLAATSCSNFSVATQRFQSSETVPSSLSSAHLLSPEESNCHNRNNSCSLRLGRSQFLAEIISEGSLLLRVATHKSCDRSWAIRAQVGRDSGYTRRIVCGAEHQSSPLMMGKKTLLGVERSRGMACRGAAAAVSEILTVKPVLDKMVLLGTVMYYYITGISALPRLPQLAPPGRRISSAPKTSAPIYRTLKKKPAKQQQKARQVSSEEAWSGLEAKLSKALSQQDGEEEEQHSPNPMLSLQAFARGSRQLLLLTALHHLRKEVESIKDLDQALNVSKWRDLSLGVLCRAIVPICKSWGSQDLALMNQPPTNSPRLIDPPGSDPSTQLSVLDSMSELLKDTDAVSAYVAKSGKADLYADLIFFLRFGSIRTGGCCEYKSFNRFAGKALEDMVVVVAEVVATLFLDSCSSVVSLSPQSETWQAFLLPSILSTRSLERFRNEVALNGWLNLNFTSVVAMFEDRFDLWTFQKRPRQNPNKKQVKNRSAKNEIKEVELPEVVLTRLHLPARRNDERKALTG